ncbi:MAG: FAD-dependent oxidoreductase [Candidatus Gastranaerophilaceae bacterium]
MFDIIIVGGGISGVSAAISAAKQDCKVLIIEKNTYLGGTSTGALVTPMMKNALKSGERLTHGFYDELLTELSKTGDSAVFKDGNPGWFNPEMMKCILDDFCEKYRVKVLFDTVITGVEKKNKKIIFVDTLFNGIKKKYSAKYYIDASGNADLAALAGCQFDSGINGQNQAMTLRFNMAGVELKTFAEFLEKIDPKSDISPVMYLENGEILLSTACTNQDKGWKLKPYFDKAVNDGILDKNDTTYFQIFSIPGQTSSIAFNCPRIHSEKSLDPLDVKDVSYALIQGRKQIRKLSEFCKKYLPGFENAYVSNIAPMIGIRDSRRVKCKYELVEEDIIEAKKFKTAIAKTNYPIDVHSIAKSNDRLSFLEKDDYYEIPLEVMLSQNIDNLIVTGRAVCASFYAQASLRIQPNCIAMGEAAGIYTSEKLKEQ